MKISIKLLALFLVTLALAGCASTSKKKCNCPAATPSAPGLAAEPVAASVAEPVAEAVAEPAAADEVPVAARKYVSK